MEVGKVSCVISGQRVSVLRKNCKAVDMSRFLVQFLCYGTIPVFAGVMVVIFAVLLGNAGHRKYEAMQFVESGGKLIAAMLLAAMITSFFGGLD